MRFALLILLLASPCFAQEAWIDDEIAEPVPMVDPLAEDVATIKRQLSELTASMAGFAMPSPAACECKCDCPSIDEIRSVVREELDRVTVTVKTVAGVEKKIAMPLTKAGSPKVMELQPGDRVVAIDGQAVTPFTYQSQTFNAPITQYQTPRYEMRVLNGLYGAVRQSCRMVNGVQVCN